MKMTVAYIAHPVRGDLEGAIKSLIRINREINLMEQDVIPFIPYFTELHSLHDDIVPERNRGVKNNTAWLEMGVVDELRLYGPCLSAGMKEEIKIAWIQKIKIRPMGLEMKSAYSKFKMENNISENESTLTETDVKLMTNIVEAFKSGDDISISLIQRKCKSGYFAAQRAFKELLEKKKIRWTTDSPKGISKVI